MCKLVYIIKSNIIFILFFFYSLFIQLWCLCPKRRSGLAAFKGFWYICGSLSIFHHFINSISFFIVAVYLQTAFVHLCMYPSVGSFIYISTNPFIYSFFFPLIIPSLLISLFIQLFTVINSWPHLLFNSFVIYSFVSTSQ